MNNPQVKIKKVSLANFRGAKDLIELNLGRDCSSSVIFGFNGEGKSTFAQAIEWFFKDGIAALSGEGIEKEDIVNIATLPAEDVLVALEFNDKELNASKSYQKDKRKSKFSTSQQRFSTYIENQAVDDRLYLNQHTMAWFLLLSKGKKKEEVAKIIGYEDIIKTRATIATALRDIEKSRYLSELRQRIANNDGLMTREIYGDSITTLEILLKKSCLFLEKLGSKEKPVNESELKASIAKALHLVPDERRAKERIGLEQLKSKLPSFSEIAELKDVIQTWLLDYNRFIRDKEVLTKINLSDFLKSAEKIVEQSEGMSKCPLCEQDIESREALLSSIVTRYKKYVLLRSELEKIKEELMVIKRKKESLVEELLATSKSLKENNISFKEAILRDPLMFLESSYSSLENSFSLRNQCDLDFQELSKHHSAINVEMKSVLEQLTGKIDSLAITQEEKEKQDIFQKLSRGTDIALENIKNRKEVEVFERQIKDMQYIDAQILLLQNEALSDALNALSHDINEYFCFLNKKDKVKNVRLEIKGEEGIEFNLDFYGKEAFPPKKYLSESQLNSLGISLFLAAVKNFNKANRFFILDDVLISFDRRYRTRLLDLLERDFSDYQIFLLTHERYWYDLIRRKFPSWVKKEVRWEFETGVCFTDEYEDWIEKARVDFKKGTNVGNDLRRGLEGFLKELCMVLDVKMPFRMGEENEARMTGELFSSLTATLAQKSPSTIAHKFYKAIEVSNFITTTLSHDNAEADGIVNLEDAIDMADNFRRLFMCPNGELVKKANFLSSENKISCKCGELKIDWKI